MKSNGKIFIPWLPKVQGARELFDHPLYMYHHILPFDELCILRLSIISLSETD